MPSAQASTKRTPTAPGAGQDERGQAADEDDRLPQDHEGGERGHDRPQPDDGRRANAETRPGDRVERHATCSPISRCERISAAARETSAWSRSAMRARPGGVDPDLGGDAAGARRHHHHPVGDEDRLRDAVGDDDHGGPGPLLEPEQLEVEALPRQGVEGAEGLVEQEDVRGQGEGPGDRGPLAHAARQLDRAKSGRRFETDEVQQLGQPCRPPITRPAGELERIGDVVGDRAPRQEARLLEHEADPRIRRGHGHVVERDPAALRCEQPGGDPQERGLAAAVRPDEGHDLAAGHVERQAVEGDGRRDAAGARRERDPDVLGHEPARAGHASAAARSRMIGAIAGWSRR